MASRDLAEEAQGRQGWALVRLIGAYLGGWNLVTVATLSIQLMLLKRPMNSDSFLSYAGLTLVRNHGWALLSLLTLMLLRAYPLHRDPSLRAWLAHLAGSLVITTLGMVMMAAVIPIFWAPRLTFLPRVWAVTKQNFHFSFLVYYWGFVGVHEGVRLFHHLRDQREVALRLQSELAGAQLHMLEMHLSPHFLFNALNAVAALIQTDPHAADQILLKLSSLLRTGLSGSTEQLATLKEELDHLETYLAIESLRFGSRLQVDLQVPPSMWDALVPSFLLQPLVEQSISRCVTPRASGGRVLLRTWTDIGRLLIEVESGGPCQVQNADDDLVMSRMASRLALLHGRNQSCISVPTLDGGIRFQVSIPFSRSEPVQVFGGEPI